MPPIPRPRQPGGSAGGYVTDVGYTRSFYRELAPAWLDLTATLSGVAPPRRGERFAWCELGCGQGATAVMLAGTHPQGDFVGVDLIPHHVDHARRLAAEAGVGNVTFRQADLLADPRFRRRFHYIVAHGVYSWIGRPQQAALRRFVERHLLPGGLVYLSYNAMPGWAPEIVLQDLLVSLARDLKGNAAARLSAAASLIRGLAAAGAPGLALSRVASRIGELEKTESIHYLVHEYMNEHWRPLFVTDVRRAMAEIGLRPAGSATLVDNFDSFVLRRAERQALRAFDDADRRELARDMLREQRFRRDVYHRGGRRLDEKAQRARLLATRYALRVPADMVKYSSKIQGAGTLSFDGDAARAIVARLADGPRRLRELSVEGIAQQDLVASVLALCCAGQVQPVEATDAPVESLNRALGARAGGPEEIDAVALRCGAAIPVTPKLLRGLHRSRRGGGQTLRSWRRYFDIHAGW